jgi:hypothetical protein
MPSRSMGRPAVAFLWPGRCRLESIYSAVQRLPHISLGQAELPGDLRWLDANLEGGANGVHLARRQMNGGRLMLPVRGRS